MGIDGVMVVNCVTTTTPSSDVEEVVGCSGPRDRDRLVDMSGVSSSSSVETEEVLNDMEYKVSIGIEDVLVLVLVPVEVDVDTLVDPCHACIQRRLVSKLLLMTGLKDRESRKEQTSGIWTHTSDSIVVVTGTKSPSSSNSTSSLVMVVTEVVLILVLNVDSKVMVEMS